MKITIYSFGKVKNKEYRELMDMEWMVPEVRDKLIAGIPLNEKEITIFTKTKFHFN